MQFGGLPSQPFTFPYGRDNAPIGKFVLKTSIELPKWGAQKLRFYPDDILEGITVNGTSVVDPSLPMAYEPWDRTIDFSGYVHPGPNEFQFQMRNVFSGAALSIEVASTDRSRWLWLGLIGVAVAATIGAAWPWLEGFMNLSIAAVTWAAICLRIFYFRGTPHTIRSYDLGGHLQYLRYVMHHLALPSPRLGAETHQPPLYYLLVGFWSWLTQRIGLSEQGMIFQWKFISLLGCIAAFGLAVWISSRLYQNGSSASKSLLFLTTLAVFPGVVFYANRISNDALFALLSFAWLGSLIIFWQNRKIASWLATACFLGLSLLTKNSGFAFIPISFVCLVLANDLSWRRKAMLGLAGVIIVAAITGWFQVPRALHERDISKFVVADVHEQDSTLHFERSLAKLVTFNPIAVIVHPFPGVREPTPRRDYFPEFYLKSAFFGEFGLPPHFAFIQRTLIDLAVLFLPVVLLGMYRSRGVGIPMLLTFWTIVLVQAAWVWREPYACHQDFRFYIVQMIPLAYFAIEGIEALPVSFRSWARGGIYFAAANSVLFLCMLVIL